MTSLFAQRWKVFSLSSSPRTSRDLNVWGTLKNPILEYSIEGTIWFGKTNQACDPCDNICTVRYLEDRAMTVPAVPFYQSHGAGFPACMELL